MPGRDLWETRACPFPASWQKPVLMNYWNFCLWGTSQLNGCYRLAKKKVIPAFVVHPRAGARIGTGQIFLGWLGAARDNSWAQVKAFWMGMPRLEGVWLPLIFRPWCHSPPLGLSSSYWEAYSVEFTQNNFPIGCIYVTQVSRDPFFCSMVVRRSSGWLVVKELACGAFCLAVQ